jgi:hypothetical protein
MVDGHFLADWSTPEWVRDCDSVESCKIQLERAFSSDVDIRCTACPSFPRLFVSRCSPVVAWKCLVNIRRNRPMMRSRLCLILRRFAPAIPTFYTTWIHAYSPTRKPGSFHLLRKRTPLRKNLIHSLASGRMISHDRMKSHLTSYDLTLAHIISRESLLYEDQILIFGNMFSYEKTISC